MADIGIFSPLIYGSRGDGMSFLHKRPGFGARHINWTGTGQRETASTYFFCRGGYLDQDFFNKLIDIASLIFFVCFIYLIGGVIGGWDSSADIDLDFFSLFCFYFCRIFYTLPCPHFFPFEDGLEE